MNGHSMGYPGIGRAAVAFKRCGSHKKTSMHVRIQRPTEAAPGMPQM